MNCFFSFNGPGEVNCILKHLRGNTDATVLREEEWESVGCTTEETKALTQPQDNPPTGSWYHYLLAQLTPPSLSGSLPLSLSTPLGIHRS